MILQSALLDNQALRVTKTYYPDGLIMPAHSHDFTSISIVLQGRLSEKVGDKTVVGSSIQTDHYRFEWDGQKVSSIYAFNNERDEIDVEKLFLAESLSAA